MIEWLDILIDGVDCSPCLTTQRMSNYFFAECDYEIHVETCNETYAGTDSTIQLQLFDGRTRTPWIHLDNADTDDFEQGR